MTTTDRIAAVIRAFPFWDYGMSDVDPNDRYAEWVPDLAQRIADDVGTGSDDDANPTTRLLRRLAAEPELVVRVADSWVSLDVAMRILARAADWLDENRHLEGR